MKFTKILKFKKIFIVISSVCVSFLLLAVIYNVFAAPKDNKPEETSKQNVALSNMVLDSQKSESDNETIAETESTEAETETETEPQTEEVKPVEIVAVENLNISSQDLAVENQAVKEEANVVDTATEVKQELPLSEISKLVYGVDVSKWQGSNIDWAKVKADGVDFAMIKMGGRSTGASGELYEDSCFERNIQGALANGIQVGVYFFSQAVNEREALEEASMVIEYIKKYKITYPVAFDWESASGYRVNNYGVSRDQLTSIASVFCDTVASYGYTPMVYFNRNDWYNSVNGPALTSKYKAWLAVYWSDYINQVYNANNRYEASTQELPNFKYSYQMWQYTSSGHVNGINGNVDMDIAFFTFANYKVDTKPVTLTVKNTTITTNKGTSVDFMNGVSATTSIGYVGTGSVTLKIIDYDGSDVSSDYSWPINHPGQYKLIYDYVDPTGVAKQVIATLIVRDNPTYTLNATQVSYTYDGTKSENDNYNALINQLKGNITALSYEKKAIDVKVTGISNPLQAGTYTATYTIDDGLGLTNTASVTVTVSIESQTMTQAESASSQATTQSITQSSTAQ